MKQLIELIVVATVFSATVFAASSAQAQTQLKPLKEVITSSDVDLQIIAYSLTRCSALFSNIGAVAANNGDKKAESTFSDKSGSFLQKAGYAQLMRNQETGRKVTTNQVVAEISTQINGISKIYSTRMQNNRLNTGNFLDDFIEKDVLVCIDLAKTFKN